MSNVRVVKLNDQFVVEHTLLTGRVECFHFNDAADAAAKARSLTAGSTYTRRVAAAAAAARPRAADPWSAFNLR